jgi:hypothetical protein
MWNSISEDIQKIWGNCVGFENIVNASDFVAYIDKVQIKTTFYFNGSTDESLKEQLKSLYLKQEFSDFVFANQGASDEQLLEAYKIFAEKTQPEILDSPTWQAGSDSLESVVIAK